MILEVSRSKTALTGVAQSVAVLSHKPKGHGFGPSWDVYKRQPIPMLLSHIDDSPLSLSLPGPTLSNQSAYPLVGDFKKRERERRETALTF